MRAAWAPCCVLTLRSSSSKSELTQMGAGRRRALPDGALVQHRKVGRYLSSAAVLPPGHRCTLTTHTHARAAGVKWVGEVTPPMRLAPVWDRVLPWAARRAQRAVCEAPAAVQPFVWERTPGGHELKVMVTFAKPLPRGAAGAACQPDRLMRQAVQQPVSMPGLCAKPCCSAAACLSAACSRLWEAACMGSHVPGMLGTAVAPINEHHAGPAARQSFLEQPAALQGCHRAGAHPWHAQQSAWPALSPASIWADHRAGLAAPEDYLEQPAALRGVLPPGPAREAWRELQLQRSFTVALGEGSAFWLSLWVPTASAQVTPGPPHTTSMQALSLASPGTWLLAKQAYQPAIGPQPSAAPLGCVLTLPTCSQSCVKGSALQLSHCHAHCTLRALQAAVDWQSLVHWIQPQPVLHWHNHLANGVCQSAHSALRALQAAVDWLAAQPLVHWIEPQPMLHRHNYLANGVCQSAQAAAVDGSTYFGANQSATHQLWAAGLQVGHAGVRWGALTCVGTCAGARWAAPALQSCCLPARVHSWVMPAWAGPGHCPGHAHHRPQRLAGCACGCLQGG